MTNLRRSSTSARSDRMESSGLFDELFWSNLFIQLDRRAPFLQLQIRQSIYSAIEDGRLSLGMRMPSSRELAGLLKVSRNTVVIAYEQLVDQNFLVSRERSGYFVAGLPAHLGVVKDVVPPQLLDQETNRWTARYAVQPSIYRNIVKPLDWQNYPYPFVFGQFDPSLFPTSDWRESARAALSVPEINNWARDTIDEDDPALIEQLRLKVLSRRGVRARPDEIMMTIGAQHALYLIARLFTKTETAVGMEDPGYPDARNIFGMHTKNIVPLKLDEDGLVPGSELDRCDIAYVTAGHQCPTTVAMSRQRRMDLLAAAQAKDIILIEDDYESELISEGPDLPPLISLDRDERVLYVGSFSKVLAPGLRLGYVVAPSPVIRELRALRRLMLRHPPLNNQRVAALFIGLGHYRSHLQKVSRVLLERARLLDRLLPKLLDGCTIVRGGGSTSYWITGPPGCDSMRLAEAARERGVVIEPGDVFSMIKGSHSRNFRLGFSSIRTDRIEAGIECLAEVVSRMG